LIFLPAFIASCVFSFAHIRMPHFFLIWFAPDLGGHTHPEVLHDHNRPHRLLETAGHDRCPRVCRESLVALIGCTLESAVSISTTSVKRARLSISLYSWKL